MGYSLIYLWDGRTNLKTRKGLEREEPEPGFYVEVAPEKGLRVEPFRRQKHRHMNETTWKNLLEQTLGHLKRS